MRQFAKVSVDLSEHHKRKSDVWSSLSFGFRRWIYHGFVIDLMKIIECSLTQILTLEVGLKMIDVTS